MINRKTHIVLTVVVLLSACAWLPYAMLSMQTNMWLRIALGIIGILSLVLLFERDMYLPFLADAAFPTSLLKQTESTSGDVVVTIEKLPKNVKVVYWAADPKDPRGINVKDVKDAYGDYENAGVVTTNNTGSATISLKCPQPYKVTHFGVHDMELPPHLHYRYELPGTKGMLSEVYTFEVKCTKNIKGYT